MPRARADPPMMFAAEPLGRRSILSGGRVHRAGRFYSATNPPHESLPSDPLARARKNIVRKMHFEATA